MPSKTRTRHAGRLIFGLLFWVSAVFPTFGWAQQWAVKMFQETEHDFGVVARGSRAEHRFVLQNIYKEDVHIAAVRSSCGCTIPEVTVRELKTWQKSEIVAVLNTHAFLGARSATITVTFDKPFYAEVQLSVKAYIRSDVVFTPGEVQFGDVDQGTPAERVLEVVYAGRPDWQITDVRSAFPHVEVELDEVARRVGNVRYRMCVRLKPDAPPGHFTDQLLVVTNDTYRGAIPLTVEGHVRSPISVSPSPLLLVPGSTGSDCSKRLLVRSSKPCRITAIRADADGFAFEYDAQAVKTTHFVTVRWIGTATQHLESLIHVTTENHTTATTTVRVMVEARDTPSPPANPSSP